MFFFKPQIFSLKASLAEPSIKTDVLTFNNERPILSIQRKSRKNRIKHTKTIPCRPTYTFGRFICGQQNKSVHNKVFPNTREYTQVIYIQVISPRIMTALFFEAKLTAWNNLVDLF